jgi:hypothetical protein
MLKTHGKITKRNKMNKGDHNREDNRKMARKTDARTIPM